MFTKMTNNPKKPRSYTRSCMALCALIACNTTYAELPIPAFNANYSLSAKGLAVGEGNIRLSESKPNHYTMTMSAQPSGLAAMVIDTTLNEEVTGKITAAGVEPQHYSRERNGTKKPQKLELFFDWSNHILKAQDNGKQYQIPLRRDVIDSLSLQLQVMWDLQRDQRKDTYSFYDDGEIKTYDVKAGGEETIDTPLGKLKTIKIVQQRQGSSRITSFWFAKEKNYIPVQIVQHKEGKETLKMTLTSLLQ